jgi:hypothetical protein
VFSEQDKIEATIKELNLRCDRMEKGKYIPLTRWVISLISANNAFLVMLLKVWGHWRLNYVRIFRFVLKKKRPDENSLSKLGIWTSFCRRRKTCRAVLWFDAQNAISFVTVTGVSKRGVRHLLPFATTYLCETTFSPLVHMKNKYMNRLNVDPDLRLKLSSFDCDMRKLTSLKQHQPSH